VLIAALLCARVIPGKAPNTGAEGIVRGPAPTIAICRGLKADARIRTADPFITNEVLYQLSYAGKPGGILGGIASSFFAAPFPSRAI
jgi:hypothetical protein